VKAATRASAVLERLFDDDYFHEQVAAGADRLRAAYRRGRAMRAKEAVQDQKLLDQARKAAGAFAVASRRLAGAPEPEPPPRRRLPVVLIGVAVLALVRSMHRAQREQAQLRTR
jgi:hypothetical protein